MAETVRVLRSTVSQYPEGVFKPLPVDNGSEFQDCNGMEHDKDGSKDLTVYYCRPYTSCERGSSERSNRIIRRYLPKGKSLCKVPQGQCNWIADDINDMPRKILDYATARERFEEELERLTA